MTTLNQSTKFAHSVFLVTENYVLVVTETIVLLVTKNSALLLTDYRYPFMAYGYDWLAFAHIVIAVAFIGPLRDPVRNKWVVEFGMIACVMVVPLAFIAGAARGIPVYWRLIDCSFGIIGFVPLRICHAKISRLEIAGSLGS